MSESMNTFYELIETIETVGNLLEPEVKKLITEVFDEKDIQTLIYLRDYAEKSISSVNFFANHTATNFEDLKLLESKKAISLLPDGNDFIISISKAGLNACNGDAIDNFKQSFVKLSIEVQNQIYSNLGNVQKLLTSDT